MWCAIIDIYIYLRVVIKNKPKNIFHCIWHFLTHTFLEIAINAQTVHHSEIKVMSPLGLHRVAEVTLLFQGGGGRDTEVIRSALSCSPFPFPCLIHWGRAFVMAAASQPGCIWGTELIFTSHNSFVMGKLVYGSCLCPWQGLELDGPWSPFQSNPLLDSMIKSVFTPFAHVLLPNWEKLTKGMEDSMQTRLLPFAQRHKPDQKTSAWCVPTKRGKVSINCPTSATDLQPSDSEQSWLCGPVFCQNFGPI